MKPLRLILSLFWQAHRGAFLIGIGLLVATLAAGAALLGLSGWFLSAAALAGMAGMGIAFDVFQPGAGVRAFAIIRTAARYGERVTTHDATLRFLAALRLRLFRALALRPFAELGRFRRGVILGRLTSDVDALDTLYLRLAAPAITAVTVYLGALAILWALVGWEIAAWAVGVQALGGALVALIWARRNARAARRRALALEAMRVRVIDLSAGAVELALTGGLQTAADSVRKAEAAAAAQAAKLDAADRGAGALLGVSGALAVAGALCLGAAAGHSADYAAIGVFTAFGLAEVAAPLRRAVLDFGRLKLAARRVAPMLAESPAEARAEAPAETPRPLPDEPAEAPALSFRDVDFAWRPDAAPVLRGLSLTVAPGEWVALAGPSGAGKTTALSLAAGALRPTRGEVALFGRPAAEIPEAERFAQLTVLSQRSELFAGTVAENLRLAAPDASDAALSEALRVARLDQVIAGRGGLDFRLGEGGAGLSGGEARRLALARALLRRPRLLLLDEACEGLDPALAHDLLSGLRAALPGTAILAAAHRDEELAAADRVVRISSSETPDDSPLSAEGAGPSADRASALS